VKLNLTPQAQSSKQNNEKCDRQKRTKNWENSLLTSIGVRGYNRGTVQVIVHYLDKKKGAKKGQKKISIRAK
jgi:hypothetical protein